MRSSQMSLLRDRETEAILEEMMSDVDTDEFDEDVRTECNGVSDIIITGTVSRRFVLRLCAHSPSDVRPCGATPKPGTITAGTDGCASGTV